MRFSRIRCRDAIGRKGRNALAARTENMLPKFDAAVILMYFIMFA